MFKTKFGWVPVMLMGVLALGACTGEVPAELLEAAARVESSSEGELEIDLSEFGDELEFVGEVEFISVGEWTIAGLSFIIDSNTEIKGSPDLGDIVKVHSSLTTEGALLAREIEPAEGDDTFAEDDDDALPFDLANEFEFVGSVDAIGSSEWVVSGKPLMILPATEVKGTIIEGDLVKVHAFLNENAEMAAREIELALTEDLDDDDMDDDSDLKLVGVLEEMGEDVWVVSGFAFRVTADTEIEDEMSEGDWVEVYFFTSEDEMPIAREIELEDDSDDDADDSDDFDDDDDDDSDEDDHDDDDDEEDDD
jgi:hypothetical protein